MKSRYFLSLLVFVLFSTVVFAQKISPDSLKVVQTLKELLTVCSSIDFLDPKVTQLGTFYKAAPYIVYRGDDKKRDWKAFANYNNAAEKTGVDNVCYRINQSVNADPEYKIIKYITKTESEGTWHVLIIAYKKKGLEKKAAFAFLKIGDRYGLGDID